MMQTLNHELKQLCKHNRDGSVATQANRERILTLIANQLRELGFVNMHVQSLKPKHVEQLVERWQAEGLSTGTLKNRTTTLRWWAEKSGKANVVAKSNDVYGIAERRYVTNVSKARELTSGDLAQVTDPAELARRIDRARANPSPSWPRSATWETSTLRMLPCATRSAAAS
jgi:site-specific recombinase XerC